MTTRAIRAGITGLLSAVLFHASCCLGFADSLPEQARAILVKHCAECHSELSDKESKWLVTTGDLSEVELRQRIRVKDAAASAIIRRIKDTDAPMPPVDAKNGNVSASDLATLEQWINEGALAIGADLEPPRTDIVDIAYTLKHIRAFLESPERSNDRPFLRFITLTNLYNMPSQSVRQRDLRVARAAVSKALNSLSWKRIAIIPKPIDPHQLILAIDIRDIGWEPNAASRRVDVWRFIVSHYPYGVKYDTYDGSPTARRDWVAIVDATGINIPMVRGDWFVTNVLQPPLYDQVLFDLVLPDIASRSVTEQVKLPNGASAPMRKFTTDDLENRLNVKLHENYGSMKEIMRMGFTTSAVSTGPRILERVESAFGSYWKSYDFKKNINDANVIQNKPLGPPGAFQVPENRVFKHDGGEIIFTLPNGLQGYMLADGRGNRLLFGPEDLVSDKAPALGSTQIVNGLSCIHCHAKGMKRENTSDRVRTGAPGLPLAIREIVERLYVSDDVVKSKFDEDETRFLKSLATCQSPFLQEGDPIEPIKSVVVRFDTVALDLEAVAAELGLPVATLQQATARNTDWNNVGLATLTNGGTINRSSWESGVGLNLFKQAIRILREGTPTTVQ